MQLLQTSFGYGYLRYHVRLQFKFAMYSRGHGHVYPLKFSTKIIAYNKILSEQ